MMELDEKVCASGSSSAVPWKSGIAQEDIFVERGGEKIPYSKCW